MYFFLEFAFIGFSFFLYESLLLQIANLTQYKYNTTMPENKYSCFNRYKHILNEKVDQISRNSIIVENRKAGTTQ